MSGTQPTPRWADLVDEDDEEYPQDKDDEESPPELCLPPALALPQHMRVPAISEDEESPSELCLPPALPLPPHMHVPAISKAKELELSQRTEGDSPPLPESECNTIAMKVAEEDTIFTVYNMLFSRFRGKFSFLYVLGRKQGGGTWKAKGIAFVVFINPETASAAKDHFGAKWACKLQGYCDNVNRFRNSDIMKPGTPCEFQPIVFDTTPGPNQGLPVCFPPRTRQGKQNKQKPQTQWKEPKWQHHRMQKKNQSVHQASQQHVDGGSKLSCNDHWPSYYLNESHEATTAQCWAGYSWNCASNANTQNFYS